MGRLRVKKGRNEPEDVSQVAPEVGPQAAGPQYETRSNDDEGAISDI